MTRTYAIVTLKPCQDREVAAIRDACDGRKLRVFQVDSFNNSDKNCTSVIVHQDRIESFSQRGMNSIISHR